MIQKSDTSSSTINISIKQLIVTHCADNIKNKTNIKQYCCLIETQFMFIVGLCLLFQQFIICNIQ